PAPPLFPYTTLFRSPGRDGPARLLARGLSTTTPWTATMDRSKGESTAFARPGPVGSIPLSPQSTVGVFGSPGWGGAFAGTGGAQDRKSTRLNSSHVS